MPVANQIKEYLKNTNNLPLQKLEAEWQLKNQNLPVSDIFDDAEIVFKEVINHGEVILILKKGDRFYRITGGEGRMSHITSFYEDNWITVDEVEEITIKEYRVVPVEGFDDEVGEFVLWLEQNNKDWEEIYHGVRDISVAGFSSERTPDTYNGYTLDKTFTHGEMEHGSKVQQAVEIRKGLWVICEFVYDSWVGFAPRGAEYSAGKLTRVPVKRYVPKQNN